MRTLVVRATVWAVLGFMAPAWPARAADTAVPESGPPGSPVATMSVQDPQWYRTGDLLVGELTVVNKNAYPIDELIIVCDFFDAGGRPVGDRGTAIRRVFGQGETRVSGIEFVRSHGEAQGGSCRVLSAKPLEEADME